VLAQGHQWLKQHEPISTLLVAVAMLALGATAYGTSSPADLRENAFTFEPIREVAILFAGIFATMIPALDLLERNADALPIDAPRALYAATGALSAFLDNAPTYLTFLTAELGRAGLSAERADEVRRFVASDEGATRAAAISAAAV